MRSNMRSLHRSIYWRRSKGQRRSRSYAVFCAPRTGRFYEQKESYPDDEIKKILDGALGPEWGTHGYAKHRGRFGYCLN